MSKFRLFVALLLPVLLFSMGSGVSAQGDMDCPDFTSQGEAQAYFEAGGGSPANNFNNLDADNDGYACENHFGTIDAPVVNQPDVDEPTDEVPAPADPVAELPDTGAGTSTTQPDVAAGILSVSVVLAGMFFALRLRAGSN